MCAKRRPSFLWKLILVLDFFSVSVFWYLMLTALSSLIILLTYTLRNNMASGEWKLDQAVLRFFGDDQYRQAEDLFQEGQKLKRISFYNQVTFQNVRKIRSLPYFKDCEVKNCIMSFNKGEANLSDAVIFNWRSPPELKTVSKYRRPQGQIWIFIQHETTNSYNFVKRFPSFNWTMTYSKHSDIFLPYGLLKRKEGGITVKRDYIKIAKNKSKDALWIVSHCKTSGKRELYVKNLQNYITVDILGSCGDRWKCGQRYDHDIGNCFDILNSTYRYYLAFENDICQEYITEKFFENYKYDLIQIVRGGDPSSRTINASKNAFISTSDFSNVHELGKYLQRLSRNISEYARMLEEKDKYYSVSYPELFQNAMCDVCKRLNKLEEYRSVYENVGTWMKSNYPCFKPNDLAYNDSNR